MFLFNKYRNAIQDHATGNEKPVLRWKTCLNTHPPYGAESTADRDAQGNLYFGSHSGNFYSLDENGNIRWVFTTRKKIYSSPLIAANKVFFAGGDGFAYCLDLEGRLQWTYDMASSLQRGKISRAFSFFAHLPFTFDFKRRRNVVYRSWCSPNHAEGRLFFTGFGKGLFCLDPEGEILWTRDLGFPRYQLTGVAIDEENRVYCASRRGAAHCFDLDGKSIWTKNIRPFWEPWGNPVVSTVNNNVVFFFSKGERTGLISVLGIDGSKKWERRIGPIRGSCSISADGAFLYCCDLNGFIYKLDARSGALLLQQKLTNAPRGLWTTPTLDGNGDLLLTTKDAVHAGRVVKLNDRLETLWEFAADKTLSVPVVTENGDVLFGSWDGCYYCIKTRPQ